MAKITFPNLDNAGYSLTAKKPNRSVSGFSNQVIVDVATEIPVISVLDDDVTIESLYPEGTIFKLYNGAGALVGEAVQGVETRA